MFEDFFLLSAASGRAGYRANQLNPVLERIDAPFLIAPAACIKILGSGITISRSHRWTALGQGCFGSAMRVPRLAWCDAPTHVAVVVTECCFHVAFLCLKLAHVEGADRAIEAFQLQFANWLGADNWFSGDLHASIDKDLSVCGSRA